MPVKVGKYLIGETLGEGAFGKVKLGKHVETNRQYAVKIIEKKDIAANSMAANVKREISIMRALKHPNIVNFHEVLISKSSLFIVMDLVKGDELYEMLRKQGRLSERDARRIFRQLVQGVAYCHEQGIFHRDLKPENILLDATNNVKITDFGMSAMTGLVNEAGNPNHLLYTACGTLYYCAPEILAQSGTGYSGDKVDSWSCGILLFLMVIGRLPFESEDMNTLTKLVQTSRLRFPQGLNPQVCDLISRLLEKDPALRLTVGDARYHPWVTDGGGSAHAPGSGSSGSGANHTSAPAVVSGGAPMSSTLSGVSNGSANSFKSGAAAGGGTSLHHGGGSADGQQQINAGMAAMNVSNSSLPSSRHSGVRPPGPPQSTSSSSAQMPQQMASGTSSVSLGESEGGEDREAKLASLAVFHGGGAEAMVKFMKETLPGKSEAKVLETVEKLAEAEIECVEDLEAVAREMNNKSDFKTFLTKEASVPAVTAMRLAQRLF
eukprot:CAMPEP_0185857622 /NCGR_PEP_ID=MMETSP1354-20130828/29599_1 /TAXON_ID=708628 /ORGANISM="Erythrolobus madagascarensis, Strain CCMP3276" /LENGTH=491 /DNA_ID=CAMNT_0028559893 /DNA_START=90 /DNA_END=1565 /DNA_ORIENTATION=+